MKVRKQTIISILLALLMVATLIEPRIVTQEVVNADSKNVFFNGGDYTVEFILDSVTNSNYSARIEICNTGDAVIDNWKLELAFEEEIDNMYNATFEKFEDGIYVIKHEEYNQDIPIGEKVTFGFSGEKEGDFVFPSSICIPMASKQTRKTVSSKYYELSFELDSKWNEGYIVTANLTNNSQETIEDWIIEFEYSDYIESIWGAELISQEGNKVIIKNPAYAQNIKAGETTEFQFQVNSKNEYKQPENAIVSSFQCNGSLGDEEQPNITGNLIDNIFIEDRTVIAGNELSDRVTVSLNDITEGKAYAVKVFENVNNEWEMLSELFDSGNLSKHGDEIKNDSVYSNFLEIYSESAKEVELKFIVYEDGIEVSEQIENISIINDVSDEEFKLAEETMEQVQECISQYVSELVEEDTVDVDEVIKRIQNLDTGENRIQTIEKAGHFMLKINLYNGLNFHLQITDNRNMDTMLRGAGDNAGETEVKKTTSQKKEYDYVLSKDILYWCPFDTDWGESDETESVKGIVEESLGDKNLTVIQDQNATVESLKKLDSYGLIIFSTHGINGEWLVTGEKADKLSTHKDEILVGRISTFVNVDVKDGKTQKYFMVHSSWFDKQDAELPNSIIINNSCESTKTNKLWKVFKKAGASAYIGYTGSVTNEYVIVETEIYLEKLLYDRLSVEESYEGSFDSYYDDGEILSIMGAGNVKMPYGFVNPDFERKLAGWKKDGDGRSISRLGSVTPTSGERMAIISTGLGYTLEKGSIVQSGYIPKGTTSMTFDWNFLSEEFLEYIGSVYDDPFEVCLTIKGENNKKDVVLDLGVNKIASLFEATSTQKGNLISVSPEIAFDHGDVWMTGWQTQVIDMTKYAGQYVKLEFSVRDASDTIYTTAVLIDNIQFDTEFETCGLQQDVQIDFDLNAIRGAYQNTYGRSYILYRPSDEQEAGFETQAPKMREYVKAKYGYKNINQVIMKAIYNDNDFADAWNNIEDPVDEVIIVCHGRYYALILSEANYKYFTCTSDGSVGMVRYAKRIADLERKVIGTLSINSCNSGLLNAVNIKHEKEAVDDNGKVKWKYTVLKNVAQTFLETQNVNTVEAWDGSVSFKRSGLPRGSYTQDQFYSDVKELEDDRVFEFNRLTGDPTLYPVGQVTYYRSRKDKKLYVKYKMDPAYGDSVFEIGSDPLK